jgi:phosphoesterase RecJ-like protein
MRDSDILRQIGDALRSRSRTRFLLTSHARPDGDSIGSQLALAAALRAIGKSVRIVNRDVPPTAFAGLPGMEHLEIADAVTGEFDALVVLECSDLSRPGVAGLEGYFTLNIDHHPGNAAYGDVCWFDASAAACGEQVADIIDELGITWTFEIATHLYLAILTDTGSFRHSHITARTFDICRRAADAGVDAAAMARRVYEASSLGKLRLIGALLDGMQVVAGGRLALLTMDDGLLARTGASAEDTDGLINMPLMASTIQAVALVRAEAGGAVRVSLRSKGDLDVRLVASGFGGGGHKNASGFTIEGTAGDVVTAVTRALELALDEEAARKQPAAVVPSAS